MVFLNEEIAFHPSLLPKVNVWTKKMPQNNCLLSIDSCTQQQTYSQQLAICKQLIGQKDSEGIGLNGIMNQLLFSFVKMCS